MSELIPAINKQTLTQLMTPSIVSDDFWATGFEICIASHSDSRTEVLKKTQKSLARCGIASKKTSDSIWKNADFSGATSRFAQICLAVMGRKRQLCFHAKPLARYRSTRVDTLAG
jgi:hypothetical protein